MADRKDIEKMLEAECESNATLRARVAELERERDETMDVLWRDIDDLRDPKLPLVQVAAKAANAIHWRGEGQKKLQSRLTQLEEALRLIRNLAMYENHHNELGHYVRIQRECDAALTPVVKQEEP